MNDDTKQETQHDQARRRLLKMAVYVPPAFIGVLSLSEAACQASCGPSNCGPQGAPCGPSSCPPRTP